MNNRLNKPAAATTGDMKPQQINSIIMKNDIPKPKLKKERFIETALYYGNKGIAQPEAYAEYYESCLHSTISDFQTNHDIKFARKPDKSTVKFYKQKPFSRYFFADKNQVTKALDLLNQYRAKRGAEPLNYPLNSCDPD